MARTPGDQPDPHERDDARPASNERWNGVPLDLIDAPEQPAPPPPPGRPDGYDEAVGHWRTPADIMDWMRDRFAYDLERALDLAEDSPVRDTTEILTPQQTYERAAGTCVDVCRLAVDAMRAIDPATPTSYLMIEFEPIRVADRTLRRHWLAVSERPDGYFVFADTKFPGEIRGPYGSLDDFVAEYEGRRRRKVVSHQLRDTLFKQLRKRRRRKLERTAAASREEE